MEKKVLGLYKTGLDVAQNASSKHLTNPWWYWKTVTHSEAGGIRKNPTKDKEDIEV
jgi:hypothetical protein